MSLKSFINQNKLYYPQGKVLMVYHHIAQKMMRADPVSHIWEDDGDIYCTFLFDNDKETVQETWNCYWNEELDHWETCEA